MAEQDVELVHEHRLRRAEGKHAREQAGDDVGAAADHDGDEGLRRVAHAVEGADIGGEREQAAGEAGERRTEAEGEHVDALGIDAERTRHARVLHGRPRVNAEARVAEQRPETGDGDERDPQHEEPVVGVGKLRQREAAEGRRHALDLRAEDEQRALAQQQAEAPGRDQRGEQLAVEAADDHALQHHAREPCAHRAEDHGDAAGHAGEIGERGDVGADHHHLAVRHVDDAHHAEDDDQPDRG